MSQFLQSPPAGATDVEKWAFYNQAEKEAKKAKEAAAKTAILDVHKTEHKFIKTPFGGAQMIDKETRKAKDSLQFVLQSKDVYEMCREEKIDLKKVDELVEAGILDEDELKEHIEVKRSPYLKIKN